MNWRSISMLGVLGLVACDINIPFLKKDQAADTTGTGTPSAVAAQPADTLPPTDTLAPGGRLSPEQEQARAQARAQARELEPSRPLADEPWTPTNTGTVDPGMSRDQVVATWGPPVAERTTGGWTYLYFRNGCEVSCGTFDVVFLENGLVVDAIVRHAAHGYSGTSSSPPGREAVATPRDSGSGGTE
jgi:hypothetical protein